ncbi:MAG: MFS transporter [Candidatus Hydrogenedentes bacterium]|nr:MFS transporter [Candidatus Hydrogenedentota bacterium]
MTNSSSELIYSSKEFRWYEGLAICLSMIGVQLCSEVINQWGLYFYSPSGGVGRTVYVSISIVGYIFIIGTIWDAFSSPVVGAISDKTPSRPGKWRIIPIHGRRRPYIFFGSLLMLFTMISFWYPPIEGLSPINFIYATAILCAHWTLFSVAVIPLNALGPEIARSESARVALGTWTAVGMIVGLAFANALPGILISKLDPARTENKLSIDTMNIDQVKNLLHKQFSTLGIDTFQGTDVLIKENTLEIKGSTLSYLKELATTNKILSLLKEGGAKKLEKSPRKAFWACEILEGDPEAILKYTRDNLFKNLLPLAKESLGLQSSINNNRIVFRSKILEQVKKDNIETEFSELRNRFKLDNDYLEFILEGSSVNTEELINRLLKIVINQNLLIPRWSKNIIVITKPLAKEISKIEIQNWLLSLNIPIKIVWLEESFSPTGYRRVAIIFSILSFILFLLPVIFVKERYDSDAIQSEPLPWGQGLKDAFRNIPFLIYAGAFFFFTIGFLAVQRVLPYWAELGLDGDESTITFLLIPFILLAVISYGFIPLLARYLHMKWLIFIALGIIASGMPFLYVIGKSNMDFYWKTLGGMLLFGYCGIGQAIIYVMMIPMLGDIIDYDESLSGERREAVYNGLSAFIWKASMAGSILLASQSMNKWGNSVEDFTGVLFVGPFAGIFGILGMLLIAFYPTDWRKKIHNPSLHFTL